MENKMKMRVGMKHKKTIIIVTLAIIIAAIAILFIVDEPRDHIDRSTPIVQADKTPLFPGKKVVWVNSYHNGYEWSDFEFKAGEEVLRKSGVKVKQLYLDMKRNSGAVFGTEAGKKAKLEIEAFDPDVIIAADDSAQKYVIVPYFKGGSIPVVFCGVNWNAKDYGYPAENVTGMIEVELVEALMGYLRTYAKGKRIAYVGIDDISARKITREYNERFFDGELKCFLIKERSFEGYCKAFLDAQDSADIVILGGNGGVVDWDEETGVQFFRDNTRKPTGTSNLWMVKYALVAYSRLAEEQGRWAAETALRILAGNAPKTIPIVKNKMGKLYVNLDIAEKMNIVFSPSLLKNAEIYKNE